MNEPKRFGRYRLLGHIADGGMASVHLAQLRTENLFTKWVAMKVVHPNLVGEERFEKMFLTEARLAAQIDHPNVAQVFDCGSVDGVCYLAMEYMSGQTLHALLRAAAEQDIQVPLGVVARVIANTALGLHAAHELRDSDGELLGIVHRDVSPQNVFVLYSGTTKLMDFGIAYAHERESSEELTAVGELKGKFAYMSPEQLVKRELDRRSDIFSLGVVLWESACGMRLFKRRTEAETAMAVMACEVPKPSDLLDDFPEELEAIILRALAREPADRYQTTQELAADLERYLASTNETAGTLQVARFVEEVFPTGKEEITSSLRRATVLLESYEDVLTPVTEEAPAESPSFDDYDLLEVTRSASQPPVRGNKRWPIAALVLGAAGLVAVQYELRSEPEPAPRPAVEAPAASAPTPPPTPAVEAPAPEAEPPPVEAPVTMTTPEPAAQPQVRTRRRRAAAMARPREEVAAPRPQPPRPPPVSAMEPGPTGPRPMTEFE